MTSRHAVILALAALLSSRTMTSFLAAQEAEVAATTTFIEGPTVDRAGNVYFSEIMSQRILKLSIDGVLSTYREHSNVANGLLIDPQGRLIACEGATFERNKVRLQGTPRVTRTDLQTGKMEILIDSYGGAPLKGPNDVTIDGKGRLYFTDLPAGTVYRIDGPGKADRILMGLGRPNGIIVSPDDTKLYVADSFPVGEGVRVVHVYDLQADGTARNHRIFYDFGNIRGIDGMSIDVQGNLYGAAGSLKGGKLGVHVISPQGKLIKIIPIPEDPISNDTFGGPDMKTLYVTAGKSLYKIHNDIPGLPR